VDCWSCHEKDDKHKKRLGKLCEDCHNALDWKRWDFDHDTRTHFKIDGAHKKLNCYDCHSKPSDDAKLPWPVRPATRTTTCTTGVFRSSATAAT